jgi:hypothetical protein
LGVYYYMCVVGGKLVTIANRTKIIITVALEIVWNTRTYIYFFSVFHRRRRSHLLMFARINSRVTSINHLLHIKRTVAKDDKKIWALRVFFPSARVHIPTAHTLVHVHACVPERRFVYFIINTNIAKIRPLYVSPTSIIYTGVKRRSRM